MSQHFACPRGWEKGGQDTPRVATNLLGVRQHWVLVRSPRLWPAIQNLSQGFAAEPGHPACDFIRSSPSMGQEVKELQNSTGPDSLATSQLSPLLTPFSTLGRWLAASPTPIPAQPGGLNVSWDHSTSCNQAAIPTSAQQEPAHAHTRGITPKVSMIHKIPAVPWHCPTLSRKAEVVGKPRNQPSPADGAGQLAAGLWHSWTTAEASAA